MTKKNKAGLAQEKAFKQRIKKIFPGVELEFTYSSIDHNHLRSEKLKAEGTFGYFEKESILVDGEPIGIAWLPHVKDMVGSHLDELLKRVEVAVRKAPQTWQEVMIDDALDSDSDNVSSVIG